MPKCRGEWSVPCSCILICQNPEEGSKLGQDPFPLMLWNKIEQSHLFPSEPLQVPELARVCRRDRPPCHVVQHGRVNLLQIQEDLLSLFPHNSWTDEPTFPKQLYVLGLL